MTEISREAVERMLARKKRALERLAAEPLDVGHALDLAHKASKAAELAGAIDVLEELLEEAR